MPSAYTGRNLSHHSHSIYNVEESSTTTMSCHMLDVTDMCIDMRKNALSPRPTDRVGVVRVPV